MSDLDRVKGFIAEGEKGSAIRLLASMLLKDKTDLHAWLLLGELIDDPARKKDCYRQALKLSPDNLQAQTRLRELDEPVPAPLPVTGPTAESIDDSSTVSQTKPTVQSIPRQPYHPPAEPSKSRIEILAYVAGGVAAFLVLLYVITRPTQLSDEVSNSSNDINNLYIALFFITLIAVMIILMVADRNRR
jgi:hypothetical protein